MRRQQEGRSSRHSNEHFRDESGRFSSEEGPRNQGYRNSDYDMRNQSGYGRSDMRDYDEGRGYSAYEDRGDRFGTGMSGHANEEHPDYRGREGSESYRNYGSQGRYSGMGNQGSSDWDRRMSSYNSGNYDENWNRGNQSDFGRSTNYGENNGTWGNNSSEGRYAGNYSSSGMPGSGNRNWESGNFDSGRASSNRGKGPRGYQRSDERVQENISDALSDDHQLDASGIEVNVSNGEVTLTGTVNNRDDKRRAEDLAENVSGVTNVENRIRISKDESSKKESSSRGETKSSDSEKSKSKTTNNIHA